MVITTRHSLDVSARRIRASLNLIMVPRRWAIIGRIGLQLVKLISERNVGHFALGLHRKPTQPRVGTMMIKRDDARPAGVSNRPCSALIFFTVPRADLGDHDRL